MRDVVIARTDLLGELVLTLSMARRLREAVDGARVTMIVAPGMEALARLCPDVTAVMAHPPECDGGWQWRSLALGAELRSRGHEAMIVVNPTKALHVAAWWSRIPVRIGGPGKGGRWLLTQTTARTSEPETRHEVNRCAALLEPLGIRGAMPAARLRPEPWMPGLWERLAAAGMDPQKPIAALHPWASKAFKRWPIERFIAVGQRLEEQGARIIVIGGPEHRAEAERARLPFTDWTGRTSLTELAALLAACRMLVSNDTGPSHVAAAVGAPVVALFGTDNPAASPLRWGPCGSQHAVIWKPSMELIPAQDVLAAARRILQMGERVLTAGSLPPPYQAAGDA